MKVNIIEKTKKRMTFELEGEDHTLCNALKSQLLLDGKVKAATYRIDHPLVGIPRFLIETDGKMSAQDALIEAAKNLQKTNSKFLKSFQKEAK